MDGDTESVITLYEGNGVTLSVEKQNYGHGAPHYYLHMDVATRGNTPASRLHLSCSLHDVCDPNEPTLEEWGDFFKASREEPDAALPPSKETKPSEVDPSASPEPEDLQICSQVFANPEKIDEFRELYRAYGWEQLPDNAMYLIDGANKMPAEDFCAEIVKSGMLDIYGEKTSLKLEGYIEKFHEIAMAAHKELDATLGKNRCNSPEVTPEKIEAAIPELDALKVTFGNHTGKEDDRPPRTWSKGE